MNDTRSYRLAFLVLGVVAVLLVGFHATSGRSVATVGAEQSAMETVADPRGYVLKHSEGEINFPGEEGLFITKASPRSGTQGSVMFYDEMPQGSTSGVHYHTEADEFFYVLQGRGTITLGETDTPIEKGDTIVVFVGEDHRITSSKEDPLVVIYFLDRPGLEEQFRLMLDRESMTLEEFNAIVAKLGTVYKSFD